ncbi:MAG: pyridoxamine 5'-phosphate oxidase [Cyclobacteriaceae bacterium]|jgi:pyridoxamine 5'-phosphate oxidase
MNIIRGKSIRQLVANFRNEYLAHGLDESRMAADPLEQFEAWFKEAVKAKIPEPNAMHLATATPQGAPSGRVMLLKGFDEQGFHFYTHYNSRKGNELAENPQGAITFLWLELFRSVRIEGHIAPLSAGQSDEYFQSRPRSSQLGAWASAQSRPLASRQELDQRFHELERKFEGQPIPRPATWGGYVLAPGVMEFWQGRASRLHDRIVYNRTEEGKWQRQRLNP